MYHTTPGWDRHRDVVQCTLSPGVLTQRVLSPAPLLLCVQIVVKNDITCEMLKLLAVTQAGLDGAEANKRRIRTTTAVFEEGGGLVRRYACCARASTCRSGRLVSARHTALEMRASVAPCARHL